MPATVRDARPDDAEPISRLLDQLEHPAPPDVVRARLAALAAAGDRALVAELDGGVVGLLTTHRTPVVHRAQDVGRITALVVDRATRRAGVGALLVAAAERILRDAGCERIEVTSATHREDAHAFYARLGYDQSGVRFSREFS